MFLTRGLTLLGALARFLAQLFLFQLALLVQARAAGRLLFTRLLLFILLLFDAFPFTVSMASGDVGGPSAGMMWALGLYELLTPEDLTDGRSIAGTGTIDLGGNVGPIGGIRDKVIAAERSNADVFLVPADNMAELEGVDSGDLELVPVSTFDEALEALGAA